jgi:hypothetical protein
MCIEVLHGIHIIFQVRLLRSTTSSTTHSLDSGVRLNARGESVSSASCESSLQLLARLNIILHRWLGLSFLSKIRRQVRSKIIYCSTSAKGNEIRGATSLRRATGEVQAHQSQCLRLSLGLTAIAAQVKTARSFQSPSFNSLAHIARRFGPRYGVERTRETSLIRRTAQSPRQLENNVIQTDAHIHAQSDCWLSHMCSEVRDLDGLNK